MRWFGDRRARHRRLQSLLAVAALGAAIALPVVLVSVGSGVASHEIATLNSSGFQVAVSAPGVHGIGGAHGLASRISALTGVAAASPVLSAAVDGFAGNTGPVPLLAEGILPGPFAATEASALRTLLPEPLPLGDPTDAAHYANGTYAGPSVDDVLVATPVAEKFGLAVGSPLVLSPTTDLRAGTTFEVTGIFGLPPSTLGPTAAFALLLPLSDLQLMVGAARTNGTTGPLLDLADTLEVGLVASQASDPAAVARVAGQIQAMVPYYGVTTLAGEVEQIQAAASVLTGFYVALSSVGIAVGLLFLTVILVRRVELDRQRIGIQRAIGLPARTLAAEQARSALALALGGSLVGIVGGIAVVLAFARFAGGTVREIASLAEFNALFLTELAAAILGLSVLASLASTRRALGFEVAEALR